MKRALVVCPGRGSYERGSLGSLQDRSPAARAVITDADAIRSAADRVPVSELDRRPWRSLDHVAGENASLLTATCSLADLADLDRDRYAVVGLCGNSMGWYTALGASGALPMLDALDLIDTMGAWQADNVLGGQLLYPVCRDDWSRDPEKEEVVEAAIARVREAGHGAWWSIRLGGHAVLGADDAGLKMLLAALPKIDAGARTFPLQLPLHSAFHTPLLAPTRDRAVEALADLGWRPPEVPLTDGRGYTFRPFSADPRALRDYTLDHQVVETFDLGAAVHSALAFCAPDVVVALGPGNPLGGPLARILVQSGYFGLRTRADFEARQAADPVLLSFGLGPQRAALVA
ncbi:MAG: ACP S-malonyltransferase [Deltaproteobacteria bacterium]|nr:ACP S-malonyltransferase [Deltaproteobacteria bacterium]